MNIYLAKIDYKDPEDNIDRSFSECFTSRDLAEDYLKRTLADIREMILDGEECDDLKRELSYYNITVNASIDARSSESSARRLDYLEASEMLDSAFADADKNNISNEELFQNLLNTFSKNVDYYDIYGNIERSKLVLDIDSEWEMGWGYRELVLNDYSGIDYGFDPGDCVIIRVRNGNTIDEYQAIVEMALLHVRDIKTNIMCSNDRYYTIYIGVDLETGEAWTNFYYNPDIISVTKYKKELEPGSYLWILREAILGNLRMSEDEDYSLYTCNCYTRMEKASFYDELPTVKDYLKKKGLR